MSLISKLFFKHTCPNCGKHDVEVVGGHKYDVHDDDSYDWGDFEICKCRKCVTFFLAGASLPPCKYCGIDMHGIYLDEFGRFGVYCKKCDHLPGWDNQIVGGQAAWQYEYHNYGYRKSTLIDQLKKHDLFPFSNFYIISNVYDARGHYQKKMTARVILLK